MKALRPILVYGSGEFGEVVGQLAVDCGYPFGGFVDDWNPGRAGVLGAWSEVQGRCAPSDYVLAMAVGYKHLPQRWELYQSLRSEGYEFPALIHPRSQVHPNARIDSGAMVMAGAIVDASASVGEVSVLWPGVVISHHSRVAANCFLSPNATVCGVATIGAACFIGASAVVVDHVEVPEGSFVKAGSVYSGKKS